MIINIHFSLVALLLMIGIVLFILGFVMKKKEFKKAGLIILTSIFVFFAIFIFINTPVTHN